VYCRLGSENLYPRLCKPSIWHSRCCKEKEQGIIHQTRARTHKNRLSQQAPAKRVPAGEHLIELQPQATEKALIQPRQPTQSVDPACRVSCDRQLNGSVKRLHKVTLSANTRKGANRNKDRQSRGEQEKDRTEKMQEPKKNQPSVRGMHHKPPGATRSAGSLSYHRTARLDRVRGRGRGRGRG
jgi:hypothetical protein